MKLLVFSHLVRCMWVIIFEQVEMGNVIVECIDGATKLTSSIKIHASQEEVWTVLKFPGRVEEFHPLIRESSMTGVQQRGLGAVRHCRLYPLGRMDEVITEWEEGQGFTISVTGGSMLPPHKFMQGRFELKGCGQECEVTFQFSYKLKYGLLGRLLDALIIRPQFKKAPPQYVQGLKKHVEQGINSASSS